MDNVGNRGGGTGEAQSNMITHWVTYESSLVFNSPHEPEFTTIIGHIY